MPSSAGPQTVATLIVSDSMLSVHGKEEFQSLILPYNASLSNIDLLLSLQNMTLLTADTCADDQSLQQVFLQADHGQGISDTHLLTRCDSLKVDNSVVQISDIDDDSPPTCCANFDSSVLPEEVVNSSENFVAENIVEHPVIRPRKRERNEHEWSRNEQKLLRNTGR